MFYDGKMTQRTLHIALALSVFSLALGFAPATHAATDGSLIKSSMDSSVYYVTSGKRYAFPNEKVFFSWYADFSGVATVSGAELASYPLAANVTYHPGSRLVKITTDPKVYAVSQYGTLRWVTTEQIAASLYGSSWNTKVDDVPDAFFTNYTIGAPIENASDYNVNAELGVTTIAQDLQGVTTPPPPPSSSSTTPTISDCQIFPSDNPWNQDISNLPVRSDSATFISSIGLTGHLHPDFGEDQSYGIPYNVVPGTQAKVPITFDAYGDESDPGPYPIPADAKVEADGDSHVLVLDSGECKLYEMYDARKNTSDNGWTAEAGAIWDLKSNALRPVGWTSVDAAGLPILPGLVRVDEVLSGHVDHAIRFTASKTQSAYILPATHFAGSDDASLPPMGLRVRLKADYDISGLTGQAKVIAQAMKTYGMILADNGSNWYFQGATDPRWNDDELNELKTIPGSAFEAVDTGPIVK